MKYIVKNCPALRKMVTINKAGKHETLFNTCSECKPRNCEDYTDCPIKQIVEKCLPQSHIPEIDDLKEGILQILQVEEVEE